MSAGVIDERIESALQTVFDPCSLAADVPINLVDMGLVREGRIESRTAQIRMTFTSAYCLQATTMVEAVRAAIAGIDEVDDVCIEVDTLAPWSEEELAASARLRLADRRTRTRRLIAEVAADVRTARRA